MSLRNYFIGTKEEIGTEIEKKVKTHGDALKYLLKWTGCQAAELGLIVLIGYSIKEIGAPISLTGAGIIAADTIQRACVYHSKRRKQTGDLNDIEEAKTSLKNALAPSLIGILRAYARRK